MAAGLVDVETASDHAAVPRGPGWLTQLLLVAAAVGIATVFIVVTLRAPIPGDLVGLAVLICLAGVLFVATGLIAWKQRPGNRTGPLMVAIGFALLLGRGARQYESPLIYTINIFTFVTAFWFLAWLLLGFPSGRVRNSRERLLLVSSFLLVMVYKPILRLFNDPQALGCAVCPPGSTCCTSLEPNTSTSRCSARGTGGRSAWSWRRCRSSCVG